MTIREDFDYTFVAANGGMLSLEVRQDQSPSLLASSPSMNAVAQVKPTREQWLEFRAVLSHVLDAEDVTAASAVEAKEPVDLSKDIADNRRLLAEERAKRQPTCVLSFDQEVPLELLKLPPTAADQKATFERWLDKHSLDDTDLNDPDKGTL